jgi:hypothetical protein
MSKNLPSLYYIYGNKTYEEEIYNYLIEHFQSVGKLNISASSGCGFKIESHDVGDLKSLDAWLENYEGWIQSNRRNEFNELESNLIDLDKAVGGCNNRLTGLSVGDNIKWIKFNINAFKELVAIRMLNFQGTANNGSYELNMGGDKISSSVPANAVVNNSTIYKKSLNGESFDFELTDCDISGYIIEYKGKKFYDFTCANHDITGYDGDLNTSTSFYDVGMDDGWWTRFELDFSKVMKIKSFNMVFSLVNQVDPPKPVGVWIDAYLKGKHVGYIHNGINGPGTPDYYKAVNPEDSYYVNYQSDLEIDKVILAFKTPIINNLDNKVRFYNMFFGY